MGKQIVWTGPAKADLRAIDQVVALRILRTVARYLATGEGDVKQLQDIQPPELRLRVATTASAFMIVELTFSSSPSSTAAMPIANPAGAYDTPHKRRKKAHRIDGPFPRTVNLEPNPAASDPLRA